MSAWLRPRPLGGILAAVILIELLLRQLSFGSQTFTPGVGWGYRNVELRRYFHEGGSTSQWDARGVRVIPGPTPHGPAILVVGNSMTQATQVGDAEVYTARLQRELMLPVLNVGHDAQSLADDIYAAPHHRASLGPAWTIAQFIPLDFERGPDRANQAHFRLVNGKLTVEPAIPHYGRFSPLTHFLRDHSALVTLGLLRFAVLNETPMPPLFRAADPVLEVQRGEGPVELELDALRDAYEGRITMFIAPDFLTPPTSAERRFTEWCHRQAASCVNLRMVFDDFRPRGRAPTGFADTLFGEGHMNPEGHAAAARLLAAEMRRLRERAFY